MKRRAVSFITVLALCLSLCPTRTLAAGWEPDTGLCPHHQVHTAECGYAPPVPEQDCAHEHDADCFITETVCAHQHDEFCGYAPESAGAPCTFVCQDCPVEDLIGELPDSVAPDNEDQTGDQLAAGPALYTEGNGQEQPDLSHSPDLQAQLDAADTPMVIAAVTPRTVNINADTALEKTYAVKVAIDLRLNGKSYTFSGDPVISVEEDGVLYLKTSGRIESTNGSGIKVATGCSLFVEAQDIKISGTRYGLYLSSGAGAQLSGGTYTGKTAAIWTADGNYSALLAPGYAYFDVNGEPILPEHKAVDEPETGEPDVDEPTEDDSTEDELDVDEPDVNEPAVQEPTVAQMTAVFVKKCINHVVDSYEHDANTPTHGGTCRYCGETVPPEKCTFSFDSDGSGHGECGVCGQTIQITITPNDDLIYDAADKSNKVTVEVVLGSGQELTEGTDYTVDRPTSIDVGKMTIKVSGEKYIGTFTKDFDIIQNQPELKWDSDTNTITMDYDGEQVELSDLPDIKITLQKGLTTDLQSLIRYSYRVYGTDSGFTDGLPTNAGDYEIKASLPEQTNFAAAETNPCLTLKIEKIPALEEAPVATKPTYNGAALKLVTEGKVKNGAVIEFSSSQNGEYSTVIPTGVNVKENYKVWYRVLGTDNYTGTDATEVEGVEIKAKEITPAVTISPLFAVYDGNEKKPQITVKDGQTVIGEEQYTITWSKDGSSDPVTALKDVGTYTAAITSNGNYIFKNEPANKPIAVTFEISAETQGALHITGIPNRVCYGDKITLSTTGGVGNGEINWTLSDDTGGEISASTGTTFALDIKELGTFTVTAERTVSNFETAEDTWTFAVEPKSVTAVVTAANKPYDGDNAAKVTAEVKPGDLVLPDDSIKIEGLEGAFSDANAGANKSVTLDTTNAVIVKDDHGYSDGKIIGDAGDAKYVVTIPDTPVRADITKTTVSITPPRTQALTYNEDYQALAGEAAAHIATNNDETVRVEYALSENGSYSAFVPQARNAGSYEVWYRVQGTDNYTGIAPDKVGVTIAPMSVTNLSVTLESEEYVYDGSAKTPAVTIRGSSGVKAVEVPSSECIVTYSDNVNAGTATVTVKAGSNYSFPDQTVRFQIKQVKAKFAEGKEPKKIEGLVYKGKAQALITAGVPYPEGAEVVYALEGGTYSTAIPTGTPRGNYKVLAKVQGSANYAESDVMEIPVTIGVNTVDTPTIELSSYNFQYNGSPHEPTVTVKDKDGDVIPPNKYSVGYKNNINVKTEVTTGTGTEIEPPTVTVTSNDENYSFTGTRTFNILPANQTPLKITGIPSAVYYGDTLQLSTTGGTGSGAVTWRIEKGEDKIRNGDSNGHFVIVGTGGPIAITATRTSDTGNYADTTDMWEFYASTRPVAVTVEVAEKDYDGKTDADVTATLRSSDLVFGDDITVNVTGVSFTSSNAGTNIPVTATLTLSGEKAGNYVINPPAAITGTIKKANLVVQNLPASAVVPYNGTSQPLVTEGSTNIEGVTLQYSLDQNNGYSDNIPTGTNAGTYTVWYRVVDNANHSGIGPDSVSVTIPPKTVDSPKVICEPDTFPYDGDKKTPTVTVEYEPGKQIPTSEYTVAPLPNAVEPDTYTVTVTDNEGGNYEFAAADKTAYGTFRIVDVNGSITQGDSIGANTGNSASAPAASRLSTNTSTANGASASASMRTSVQNGTASTVINAAAGSELVNEAVATGSKNVVIKPEIAGGVTKAEVSLPAATVSRIKNETEAALTVSTPIADVTIPNAALDTLSGAGGTVSIVTEQVENTVVLTLTADGKDVGNIPGGMTLTVPRENAGPGTVAVLVHEDGTRETVRWSVAEDGAVRIPLNGSATVEIVDNSKEFVDVSAESWAADAVAFTSAHELFNGTGETTFSPEQPMSRAMLATVLYNLEGCPDQGLTDGFSDVDGSAWYAASVSWAAKNGITGGYGDGQFAPDENITREQFAVMLWRYAGSSAADEQALTFTDADQASGYAMEALCWAVANGILNGHSDGRLDPCGLATRAQAAQMMKNFIENM